MNFPMINSLSMEPDAEGVNGCEQAVDDGFEVFRAGGRESDDAHAAVIPEGSRDVPVAAVHGDLVSAFDEPRADLLGECLETAVVRRHAPDSEDRDTHRHLALMDRGAQMVQARLIG